MPRCVQMISDVSLSANNSTLVAYLLDAASLVHAYVLCHSGTPAVSPVVNRDRLQ
jgi:hypothetical protein